MKIFIISSVILFVVIAQNGFDFAFTHAHQTAATIEGRWAKRTAVPSVGTWPMGNAITIRDDAGVDRELFYGFTPVKDGPLIAMMESRVNARVRATYDPVCLGVISFEDITPAPTPVPTPTPTPTPPVIEYKDVVLSRDTERVRTDLYQEMYKAGYAAWSELKGNKIRFRRWQQ